MEPEDVAVFVADLPIVRDRAIALARRALGDCVSGEEAHRSAGVEWLRSEMLKTGVAQGGLLPASSRAGRLPPTSVDTPPPPQGQLL